MLCAGWGSRFLLYASRISRCIIVTFFQLHFLPGACGQQRQRVTPPTLPPKTLAVLQFTYWFVGQVHAAARGSRHAPSQVPSSPSSQNSKPVIILTLLCSTSTALQFVAVAALDIVPVGARDAGGE